KELEEQASMNGEQLLQFKDENTRLKESLHENQAQKEDQEERISTLEQRYLTAQRESTSLHELNEKLEHELRNKEAQLKLGEEKVAANVEKLELCEQRLAQMELSKRQEAALREQASFEQANLKNQLNHKDQEHQVSLEERIN